MSNFELVNFESDHPSGITGAQISRLSGHIEPVEVNHDTLRDKLVDINHGYTIIWGSDRRHYEVCMLNPEQSENGVIARPSTGFSSLLKNPGSTLELAYAAAANPEYSHLYIASFGNKPTGGLSHSDLVHVARTGRFTQGEGITGHPYRSIVSVDDLVETLDKTNMLPTHFSANAEAGRLALGMMTAMQPGDVRGVFLNGLDGISSRKGYAKPKLIEDVRSRMERRRNVQPVGVATPESISLTKDLVPEIYSGLGRITHLPPYIFMRCFKDLLHKGIAHLGVSAHRDLDILKDHAIYHDLSAAIANQHEAQITIRFNRQSGIHNLRDCIRFGSLVVSNEIAQVDKTKFRYLIGDGELDQQQLDPSDSVFAERIAFSYR